MRGLEQPAIAALTVPYAAPELIAKSKQLRISCNEMDKKIDVYAFAITLLEVIIRQPACKYS